MCDKNVDPSSFEDNQMKLTKWPGALTVRSRLAKVGQTRERCSPKGQGFKKCVRVNVIFLLLASIMAAVIYLDLASLKFL